MYIYTCNTIIIQLPPRKPHGDTHVTCIACIVTLLKPAKACDLQGAKRFSRSSPKPSCPSSFLPHSHQSPAVLTAAEKSPPKTKEARPGASPGSLKGPHAVGARLMVVY